MKAIIYYRKSTDRDDKQANSLEHQLENCRKTTTSNSLDIYKEIWESRSAKSEWTRDGFNEVIRLCKIWKIDYIIIDEPKRLSRNNIDTSRVIDLLDKKLIKWILWTSREYQADNSRDKFLLQLDLSLSKMDNEDRAKDTRDKMNTCIKNTGRFLWLAPFWYKHITIKKWHKDIIIDEKKAKLVKEIFELRLENKAFSTIANILKEKYGKKIKFNYSANRIHRLVSIKFYYGVFTWQWKEIIWKHKSIISKEIYDRANAVWKWVHEKIKTLKKVPPKREVRKYHLKGFLKDSSWMRLTGYTTKGHIYYSHQYSSKVKVSINQDILFKKIWEYIKKNDCENKVIKSADKKIILDLIKQEKLDSWIERRDIDSEIKVLKNRQNKLLDFKLDEKITDEIYLFKHNTLEDEIKELLEQKINLNKDDFEAKTLMMLELVGNLYRSYSRANMEWKTYIIKKLMLELFINTKKELQIAESNLLKSSKMLDFSNGIPKGFDIRTFKEYLLRVKLDELIESYKFIKSLRI